MDGIDRLTVGEHLTTAIEGSMRTLGCRRRDLTVGEIDELKDELLGVVVRFMNDRLELGIPEAAASKETEA